MRMQNEVTNSLGLSFERRLMAAAHPGSSRCPPGAAGAVSRCGGFAARLLPAPLALTHFPAVFLHSDRGPSRTSVTSQPTGFSISYCFHWKNVLSVYTQAYTSVALHINVGKPHKSQGKNKELEQTIPLFADYFPEDQGCESS